MKSRLTIFKISCNQSQISVVMKPTSVTSFQSLTSSGLPLSHVSSKNALLNGTLRLKILRREKNKHILTTSWKNS